MRARLLLVALWVVCATNCAKPTDEDIPASTGGGTGGKGGKGGFSGKGGTGAKGGSGGTSASGGFGGSFGGSGGLGASGGFGGTSATGGTSGDSGVEAGDSGNPSGFGPCVTQQDIDSQSSQPFEVGFCFNPFACFACTSDAVNPGDIVCSPGCLCVPLPPLCGDDAGTDGSDDGANPDDGGTDADDASD